MFALHEQGCPAAEIVRRCAEGTASAAPFQVPRRTAHQIVTTMAREQGLQAARSRSRTHPRARPSSDIPGSASASQCESRSGFAASRTTGSRSARTTSRPSSSESKLLTAVRRLHNGSGARSKSPTANGTAPNGKDPEEPPQPLAGTPPGARAGHRSRPLPYESEKRLLTRIRAPQVPSTPPERQPHRVKQATRAGRRSGDRGADRGLDHRGVHGGGPGSDRDEPCERLQPDQHRFPGGNVRRRLPAVELAGPGPALRSPRRLSHRDGDGHERDGGTFASLAAGTRYWAVAQVSGSYRYVAFTAGEDIPSSGKVTIDPDPTLAADSDERVPVSGRGEGIRGVGSRARPPSPTPRPARRARPSSRPLQPPASNPIAVGDNDSRVPELRTGLGPGWHQRHARAPATSYVTDGDSRNTNARTPTAHKASHATGGSDVLSPSEIGAAASSRSHAHEMFALL